MRTAWAVLSGSPGGLSWETTSAASVPGGMASSQRLNRVRGRRYRRPPMARPTSESGPISTVRTGCRVSGCKVREASSARVTATGTTPSGLARGAGVGVGDQPAQRPVAGAVVVSVRQHDDASPELGAVVAVVVKDREVHPDDRIQPGCHARLQVLDGSVQSVAVRAGQRGGAVSGCGGGKFIRPGDAIVGAERGGDVQVGEAHADSGFRRGCRASWILRSRHRPLPTCRLRSRVRVESAA